jgi:ReqiPepy6 Gp37-like protein
VSTSDWRIDVRDKDRNRVGEIDDYQQLDMVLKYNDVSTWQLQISRRNRLAADLLADGAGIIVYRNGQIQLSGYWTDQDHSRDVSKNTVTVSGVDDTGWLGRRKAYADPDDINPPFATASDVRTGQASAVIRQFIDENGGLATPVARRIPGLFAGVEVDPALGPTVTGTGKWQLLLPLCQELATASEAKGTPIGFRIVQSGTDLLLVLSASTDKTAEVVFSLERGNLAAFSYKRSAPTATHALVGGTGDGAARTFSEKTNGALAATWGRIEGDLVDAANGDSANELSQAADQALTDGAGTTSLSVTPIDLPTQQYGIDYQLGDKVTVLLDSIGPMDEVVVADAVGQGTSVTTDYLIAIDDIAPLFPPGTRVLLKTAAGDVKEPGVRIITDNTNIAFGFVNLEFSPAASVSTVAGDHLVAVEPPNPVGDPIQDLIREVSISLTPGAEKITPAVGNANTKINPTRIFSVLRSYGRSIANLQRRGGG